MSSEERTIVNLSTASTILAIVSIFFFGTLLSACAFGCALMAFAKYKSLEANHPEHRYLDMYKKRAKNAIILSAIILVLNAAAVFLIYPTLAADYGDILSMLGGSGSSASVPKGSIWG